MPRRVVLVALAVTATVALVGPALANGAVVDSSSDVEAMSAALTGVAKIVPGYEHTCARMTNGTAKCWGKNDQGQLGDGTFIDSYTPRNVKGSSGTGVLSGIVDLVAGDYHTCALMADHTARCWGRGASGQLGDGSLTARNLPRTVRSASGSGSTTSIAHLRAGSQHTCAVLTNGTARCWGANSLGALGDGSTSNSSLPRTVQSVATGSTLHNVVDAALGFYHSCFLIGDGTARCTGYNGFGQLGNNSTADNTRAVAVAGGSGSGVQTGIVNLQSGYNHLCALLNNGTARCWGYNVSGALGDGTTTERHVPRTVENSAGTGALSGVSAIAASDTRSCALFPSGRAQCWGSNYSGALGDGSTAQRTRPRNVKNSTGSAPLVNIGQIGLGSQSSCARMTDATARCWGANNAGQLGNGNTVEAHLPVVVKS